MERKGISVFLRVRNEEKTLRLALLSSMYISDQIVVVDNCSKDNSFEIAQEFKKEFSLENMVVEKFEYDPQERESTLADLYNYTVSFTTGKWLVKWDGDCYCEEENCRLIRNSIDKYEDNKNVDGLYLSNRIIYKGFEKVSKNLGTEMGIFRYHKGLTYVAYQKGLQVVGQKLYNQEKYFLADDLLEKPIWHIRLKTSEELVRSRFILHFYRQNPDCSLEEFIERNKEGRTFEQIENEMFLNDIELYNEHKHGKIPEEILSLK